MCESAMMACCLHALVEILATLISRLMLLTYRRMKSMINWALAFYNLHYADF